MSACDVMLLILRLVLGLTLAYHGYDKFFGSTGISGYASWFESIGLKPGAFHARVCALAELAAGLGLAAGLLTPIPAAGFVAVMSTAVWTVHRANGFMVFNNGWEYNLVLATGAVAVATFGAGRYSLDHLIFGSSWQTGWCGLAIAVLLGLAGSVGELLVFYRKPAKAEEASQ